MSGTVKFLARFADEIKGLLGGHESNKNNPHNTTKEQIGLDKVGNYSFATDQQISGGADNAYLGPGSGRKLIQREYFRLVKTPFTLDSNATKTFNLATMLGGQFNDYEILQTDINLRVKDPDNTSPTFDYYIGAEGVALVGIKPTGEVLIKNLHDSTLAFYVSIIAVRK